MSVENSLQVDGLGNNFEVFRHEGLLESVVVGPGRNEHQFVEEAKPSERPLISLHSRTKLIKHCPK